MTLLEEPRKIQETDSQKDIIYKEENGEKTPITQKVVQPKIEGAIITAKGANDMTTKTNIIQAVEAATGLATHKIQVFEMKLKLPSGDGPFGNKLPLGTVLLIIKFIRRRKNRNEII